MALLEVHNLSKQQQDRIIVADIRFEQRALQKIAITGESGSGKTTLLKMISGHAQPTDGTILFDGKRVIGPEEKLLPGHKEIAYLSQHYELLNNYRVEELIWFENKLSEAMATELFKICRIYDLLQRRTGQLSGGEKQRIALCMLLVKQPGMLVMDEPFSNLDLIHKDILKAVLEDIREKLQVTCMLASHDPHDTLSWADEIIVMKEGRLLQQGTPQEVYHKPVNEYVAGLFGKYNLLKPHIAALFGIDSKGDNVMTRPENFKIYKTGNGVKGIIKKISFWGSYYEAEVLVDDMQMVVKMVRNEFQIGEKVFISL
ncbi:MAG TPA: ABC transporter ATP-binding protein [Parafilimonas sp.]|nr:ABC transporter ATP-binding protein [Parafilimonas sp.]